MLSRSEPSAVYRDCLLSWGTVRALPDTGSSCRVQGVPSSTAVISCYQLPCTLTCTLPSSFLLPQVYVHVDESLHGMDVIKAFDAVNYFIQVRVVQGRRGSGLMKVAGA